MRTCHALLNVVVLTLLLAGCDTQIVSTPAVLVDDDDSTSNDDDAANDDDAQPEAKDVLRDAFAATGVPAEVEVYAGAMHGWCPPDSTVYHEAQAERAWSRLLALFGTALA